MVVGVLDSESSVGFGLQPSDVAMLSWRHVFPALAAMGSGCPEWFDNQATGETSVVRRVTDDVVWALIHEFPDVTLGELLPGLVAARDGQVEALSLGTRMKNALLRAGYQTLADILEEGVCNLYGFRNIGRSSIDRAIVTLVSLAIDTAVATPGQLSPLAVAVTGEVAWSEPDANELAERFLEGESLAELAMMFGATPERVRRIIVRADTKIPVLLPRRPETWLATREQCARIEERANRWQSRRRRAVQMAEALAHGETLGEVAASHGIGGARVRQVVNGYADQTILQLVASRKAAAQAETQRRVRHLDSAILAWSEANPGGSASEAAKIFGVTATEVNAVLGERRNLHTRSRRGGLRRWSDAELADVVSRFVAETALTSCNDFDGWSRSVGGASSKTICARFGRWDIALRQAGVDGVHPIRRERRYAQTDLWAALIEFLDTPDVRYTFQGYQDWARQLPGRPSGALLRIRLGLPWVRMRDQANTALCDPGRLEAGWVHEVTERRSWGLFARSRAAVDDKSEAALAARERTFPVAYRLNASRMDGDPDDRSLSA